ncbi:MAG: helix-turn-helix domain-containing protein [Eubacteriales bacterium]|nr:helix-turn-helix domain-containing protein [Eubacteriales bacterium]
MSQGAFFIPFDALIIISNNIKYLRERKGYTQEQLAEAADLSVSHLSKVESGQRRIGMKAYLAVLKALDVGKEGFVALTAAEKSENCFIKFQEIMNGCSEDEQEFLIESLQSIKKNMEKLLKKVDHTESLEDKYGKQDKRI